MTSDFEVPDGNKDLNDTEEEQTATSNNQTSPATCGSNSRCACASSKTELTMTLNKLKKTGSGVQRNGPECSCAATRQKKALTTHTSPSKLIDIFSLPVATLCTPLKLPIISDRSCGNSPDKHIQRRTEELSFEDGVLQTPPPEYSSRFTLFDIPPDYEAVTGIPLARDLVSCYCFLIILLSKDNPYILSVLTLCGNQIWGVGGGGGEGHSLISGIQGCAAQQGLVVGVRTLGLGNPLALNSKTGYDFCPKLLRINK